MKTKYITLIVALLFCLYAPAQAQSDEGSIWDGIEGTLTNMFDNTIQGTEAGRLFMLFNSDISMIMKAHNDIEIIKLIPSNGDGSSFGDILNLAGVISSSDASMTAEFDWDNKALSMHLKKSATEEMIGWAVPGIGFGEDIKTNEAIDQYQFTDKDGYWYVPFKHPTYQGTGEQNYVKFNAKRAAQVAAEGLSELAETMVSQMTKIDESIDLSQITEINESMTNEIRNMLNERYLSIVGFPVFIHWALLYSPNFIRARFNVTETTRDCNNIPNGCTKLTVDSGKERGKSMIFDQYNRLIYIDSKKDGSVQFFYGRDLTVNVPAAWKMSDIIGDAIESNRRN